MRGGTAINLWLGGGDTLIRRVVFDNVRDEATNLLLFVCFLQEIFLDGLLLFRFVLFANVANC